MGKPAEGRKDITIRFDTEVIDALDKYREEHGCTRAWFINKLIRESLKMNTEEN